MAWSPNARLCSFCTTPTQECSGYAIEFFAGKMKTSEVLVDNPVALSRQKLNT